MFLVKKKKIKKYKPLNSAKAIMLIYQITKVMILLKNLLKDKTNMKTLQVSVLVKKNK